MSILPAMLLLLLIHLYRSIRDIYVRRRLTSILMAPVTFAAFVLSFGIYNYAIFYLSYLLIQNRRTVRTRSHPTIGVHHSAKLHGGAL